MGQYADMLAALPPEQRRKLPYNHPLVNGYTSEVEQAAGVPPGWLHAIKNYGERSNSDQTSPTGAKGVMQFMPKTADAYGVRDPSDPLDAIPGAARYVNKMRRQFGDRPDLVFAGYNGGEGNLERVGRNIARMPPETQAYVQRTYGALTGGQPAPAAPAAPMEADPGPPTLQNPKTQAGEPPMWANDPTHIALGRPSGFPNMPDLDFGPHMSHAILGVGKRFMDWARSAQQAYADDTTPLESLITGADTTSPRARLQQEQAEANARDKPIMDDWAGALGYSAPTMVATAPLGGVLNAGSKGLGAALPFASRFPRLTGLLGMGGTGAAVGAGLGALDPTTPDQSRLQNAGTNAAVSGAVNAGVGVVGNLFGDAAERLPAAKKAVVDFLRSKGIEPTLPQLDPDNKWLGRISRWGGQLPFGGYKDAIDRVKNQWYQGVSRTWGQDNPDLQQAAADGYNQLGDTFDRIYGKTELNVNLSFIKQMNDVYKNQILAGKLNAGEKARLKTFMQDLNTSIGANQPSPWQRPIIPGSTIQTWNQWVRQALKDPALLDAGKSVVHDMNNIIQNGVAANLGPDEAAALATARSQYKNLINVDKAFQLSSQTSANAENLRNPFTLARTLQRDPFYRTGMEADGTGHDDLTDITKSMQDYWPGAKPGPGWQWGAKPGSHLASGVIGGELAAESLKGLAESGFSPDKLLPMAKTAALGPIGGLIARPLNSSWMASGTPWLADLLHGMQPAAVGAASSGTSRLNEQPTAAAVSAQRAAAGQPNDGLEPVPLDALPPGLRVDEAQNRAPAPPVTPEDARAHYEATGQPMPHPVAAPPSPGWEPVPDAALPPSQRTAPQ